MTTEKNLSFLSNLPPELMIAFLFQAFLKGEIKETPNQTPKNKKDKPYFPIQEIDRMYFANRPLRVYGD